MTEEMKRACHMKTLEIQRDYFLRIGYPAKLTRAGTLTVKIPQRSKKQESPK